MTSPSSTQPRLPDAALRAFLATAKGSYCASWLDAKSAQRLLQAVYVVCTENLRFASMDRNYIARELCGDDFWFGRPKRERICAGICLVYLVNEVHVLPLRLHKTKSGKGSKRYWRLDPTARGRAPAADAVAPFIGPSATVLR